MQKNPNTAPARNSAETVPVTKIPIYDVGAQTELHNNFSVDQTVLANGLVGPLGPRTVSGRFTTLADIADSGRETVNAIISATTQLGTLDAAAITRGYFLTLAAVARDAAARLETTPERIHPEHVRATLRGLIDYVDETGKNLTDYRLVEARELLQSLS